LGDKSPYYPPPPPPPGPFTPGHVKVQFRVMSVMSYGCTMPC
jgi:hypothetical protein